MPDARWTGAERGEARRSHGAFFTSLPAATALAALAVRGLRVDWTDHARVAALRIGDPACGAGILLEAAWREARRLQAAAGVPPLLQADPQLIGLDIDRPSLEEAARRLPPSAQLWLLPYGVIEGRAYVGALELLDPESDVRERAERITAP